MDEADASTPEPFEFPGGGARSRWLSRLGWPAVAALSFLVFELTSNPSLAVALGCLKFGVGDVLWARRVKRVDPDRMRALVCARFAMAWGAWKVSMVATVLMFAVIGAVHRPGPGPNLAGAPAPLETSAVTAMLLSVLGFVHTALLSTVAVVSALGSGVRVWVGRRRNRAGTVILTTLVGGFAVALLFFLVPAFSARGVLPGEVVVGGMMAGMIGGAFATLWLREWLVARIAAEHPDECWPEPDVLHAVWSL